jgi:acetyltransferase-like isoleucine patch superfamily enzyme
MGVKILPEVELGDFTIVGAGSIVTKSFPEGYCVIAGNPAKLIRKLDPEKCVYYRNDIEYNGFFRTGPEFDRQRRKFLSV